MAHRHCSALVVTCVVYASDGRFLREISSSGISAEFPAVQLTLPAQTQGDSGKMRMELALDKIGSSDLVFFLVKKSDGSSFYDVLNFQCSLIGYGIAFTLLFSLSFSFFFLMQVDNKEVAQFPTMSPTGDHQSLVIGATTSNSALSSISPYPSPLYYLSSTLYSPFPSLFPYSSPSHHFNYASLAFCCPNVVLDGEWKFHWMSLRNANTSNDRIFSLYKKIKQI
jgi:hypothetical protein